MKKIATTQRLIENTTYPEIRECLDIEWGRFFKALNYLQISLPLQHDFEKYFEHIDIDGIILTGGNDLSIFSNNKLSKQRDNFEDHLISFAIKNNIPLLGICRGMQIIAKRYHGNFNIIQNHIATNHKIFIDPNSLYYKELKQITKVNSFHKYGLNDISMDFIISAQSEDGNIEAIEHKKNKILAIMWHPEREKNFINENILFIKKFFES